jgi:hypothetical protein
MSRQTVVKYETLQIDSDSLLHMLPVSENTVYCYLLLDLQYALLPYLLRRRVGYFNYLGNVITEMKIPTLLVR